MGIINIFKKGIRELNSGVDTWVVEWTKRYGQYHGDIEKCYQAFTDKDEAEEFAKDIKRAHKLIGNSCWSETQVYVKHQKSGL